MKIKKIETREAKTTFGQLNPGTFFVHHQYNTLSIKLSTDMFFCLHNNAQYKISPSSLVDMIDNEKIEIKYSI
jgi:hypothetical protein